MPTDPINTLNNNINILNNNINILNKFLSKIDKLPNNQQKAKAQQDAERILEENLKKMNILLEDLGTSMSTNINVAEGQKSIPFQTSIQVQTALMTQPTNPDDYTEIVNVYAQNNSKLIQHMTFINDGPGDIFFIVSHAQNQFSTIEILLHPNDQRELFNVYEVRLRVTQPLTSFRLIEGVFRTGSFAPATKANVEIRPTIQANEVLKNFTITCDNQPANITITHPPALAATYVADYTIVGTIAPPLPAGGTVTLFDSSTGLPMPFTIPEGWIFESFALFTNSSTEFTSRNYFEFVPGIFSLTTVFPSSSRGLPINAIFNISEFSSEGFNPTGAPAGGLRVLVTFTNDDPFNDAILEVDFFIVLRRLS